jgi:hypothetical protein
VTCTACERAGSSDCARLFVCRVCHERKRVCWSQVGGFDDKRRICAACHFKQQTGRRLQNKYTNHRVLRAQQLREEMEW